MRYASIGFVILALFLATASAQAANFSFRGNFQFDDDVQLFNFSVGAPSDVTLRTYSYAGGTQADGTVISAGGFDPILALFSASGLLIDDNDDGTPGQVGVDPVTGQSYDTYLEITNLAPGDYRVAVSQYDNFANGPTLADGFSEEGNPNFTLADYAPPGSSGYFWDVTGDQRESYWAFDVLNVDQAVLNPVPIPGAVWLLGSALAGLFGLRRKFRS